MKTIAVVQARMGSSRFPGKVLAPVEGEPMIMRQVQRIRLARLIDEIVVATGDSPGDDELVDTLESVGIQVVRGSEHDVLSRFIRVMDYFGPDTVVRLTADCPLISPQVIDHVIEAFIDGNVDYASNTLDPHYPDGLDVEVMRADALRILVEHPLDQDEREHVTLGVYRRPEAFSLLNVLPDDGSDWSSLRWTVDTSDDLAFVQWVYSHLWARDQGFEFGDILELLAKHPSRSRTSRDAVRNAALVGKDAGVMKGVGR